MIPIFLCNNAPARNSFWIGNMGKMAVESMYTSAARKEIPKNVTKLLGKH